MDEALIVKELRRKYNFKDLLKFIGTHKRSYYYTINKSDKIDKYIEIKCEIKEIYHVNKGRYDHRRVHIELKNRGFKINHKTVYTLMKELSLKSFRPKKYKSYKGEIGKNSY